MEIIIGKQRQGQTGTVQAIYKGPTTKIEKAHSDDVSEIKKKMADLKDRKRPAKRNG